MIYTTGYHTEALFTWRQGAPPYRATRLGGLKHSPSLHASRLSERVSRAAANHNKQDGGQQKRFGSKFIFFLSLVPLKAAFQCLGYYFVLY